MNKCAILYVVDLEDMSLKSFIFVADVARPAIYQINMFTGIPHIIPLPSSSQPLDIAIDPTKKIVYWADSSDATIRWASLDGKTTDVFLNLGKAKLHIPVFLNNTKNR